MGIIKEKYQGRLLDFLNYKSDGWRQQMIIN